MKKIAVIGGGFGGLASAILLAKKGHNVTILEKNNIVGGRANTFESNGFKFDMGPSWYLMPDVFQKFFDTIGENIEDYLDLVKLQPSYRIFFKDKGKKVDIYADLEKDLSTLESLEPGVSENFRKYLKLSEEQYGIAMGEFVYKNADSFWEFFRWDLFIKSLKLKIFTKMSSYVKNFFKTDEIQKIVSYPLLFLGTSPYDAPAMYNIMSHVDFNMGVRYPQGGIYEISKALEQIAKKFGVEIQTDAEVKKILVKDGEAYGVRMMDGTHQHFDTIVSNADLHHSEVNLLDEEWQTYPESYRKDKKLAPSAFIVYLGLEAKTPEMTHHNLIFSQDWKKNFGEIFDEKVLPEDPSMYICVPSRTDSTVAPEGKENWFILVPMAPGVEISDEKAEEYYEKIMKTISQECGIPDLLGKVEYKRIFHGAHFADKYNAFQGTALGLAHTFFQSSVFRPSNMSKKVKNLYYVGAYVNPGIGMPMCLISAELLAKRLK